MEEFLKEIAQEVPPEEAKRVHSTLAKILDNILRNPCESKFRTLRKENKMVAENICISMAAVSLLFLVGFEDWDDSYHCPMETDLGQMHGVSELLRDMTMNLEVFAKTPSTTPQQQSLVDTRPPVVQQRAQRSLPEAEIQRRAQLQQLQQLRAQQHAQHSCSSTAGRAADTVPVTAQAVPMPDLLSFEETQTVNDLISTDATDADQSSITQAASASREEAHHACASNHRPPLRTVFDFHRRSAGESHEAGSLNDIRRLRQERFEQFQTDPDARLSPAYTKPPSGSLNADTKATEFLPQDASWNKWMSDASTQLLQGASKTSEQFTSGLADASNQLSQGLVQTSARLSCEFEGVKERLSAGGWLTPHTSSQAEPGPLPARFRVVGKGGALVRNGVEKDSQVVEMLRQPTEFEALEAQSSSDGTLRMRIEEPCSGWLSFKPKILRRVGELPAAEDVCGETRGARSAMAFSGREVGFTSV